MYYLSYFPSHRLNSIQAILFDTRVFFICCQFFIKQNIIILFYFVLFLWSYYYLCFYHNFIKCVTLIVRVYLTYLKSFCFHHGINIFSYTINFITVIVCVVYSVEIVNYSHVSHLLSTHCYCLCFLKC